MAGKMIALQNPIALSLAEADRIVSSVQRHGVAFTLAWHWIYRLMAREARV
jgi:predicted dehydrogenase